MTMRVFASIVSMLTMWAVCIRCEEIRECVLENSRSGRCIPWRSCPEMNKSMMQPLTLVEACGGNSTSDNPLICCQSLEPKDETITNSSAINSVLPAQCGRRPPIFYILSDVEDSDHVHMWAVFLEISKSKTVKGRCVGTMITDRYVLTAADCLYHLEIDDLTMYFGLFKRSELAPCLDDGSCQERKAAQFIIHEEYREQEKLNNIALIRTKDSVQTNDYISPICLPLNHVYDDSSNNSLLTVGWGMTIGEKLSDAKKVALLRVIPKDECEKPFRSNATVPPSIMCTLGNQPGQDVCQGDSGAPLEQVHNRLIYVVGVVSSNPRCGITFDVPGKAMRVSHYMNWILTKISRSGA